MFDVNAAAMHGGTDALGVPAHDFSTNRNACGPCPMAVKALQAAHVAHTPIRNTPLRAQLAAFHGVAVERILIGGSSSELIHRLTCTPCAAVPKACSFPSTTMATICRPRGSGGWRCAAAKRPWRRC
jgi:histidinol-phosphate aminotransferase